MFVVSVVAVCDSRIGVALTVFTCTESVLTSHCVLTLPIILMAEILTCLLIEISFLLVTSERDRLTGYNWTFAAKREGSPDCYIRSILCRRYYLYCVVDCVVTNGRFRKRSVVFSSRKYNIQKFPGPFQSLQV